MFLKINGDDFLYSTEKRDLLKVPFNVVLYGLRQGRNKGRLLFVVEDEQTRDIYKKVLRGLNYSQIQQIIITNTGIQEYLKLYYEYSENPLSLFSLELDTLQKEEFKKNTVFIGVPYSIRQQVFLQNREAYRKTTADILASLFFANRKSKGFKLLKNNLIRGL